MRQTVRLVVLGVLAAAAVATVILAVLYVQYGALLPSANGGKAPYTLGTFEGQLAVFEGATAFPMKVYEVPVASLPQSEQQKLRSGIAVASMEELQVLLEDYTS